MNWKTHKRLAFMAAIPALGLLTVFIVLVTAAPFGGRGLWPFFFGIYDNNPLGASLDIITVAVMGAHLLYLSTGRNHPRHRGYFVFAAFVLGLVANGVYEMRLGHTEHFFQESGGLIFFTTALVFYCVYRLVVLVPLMYRRILTALLAVYLLIIGGYQFAQLYIATSWPCTSDPVLWLELIGKCGVAS